MSVDTQKRVQKEKHKLSILYQFLTNQFKSNKKVPKFLHKIKVTNMNANQSCELSTSFHYQAIEKAGRKTFNLEKMQFVLWSFEKIPTLNKKPTNSLSKFLPTRKSQQVYSQLPWKSSWAIKYSNVPRLGIVTQNEAEDLISTKQVAANKVLELDDSVIKINLYEIYQKTMQESPTLEKQSTT